MIRVLQFFKAYYLVQKPQYKQPSHFSWEKEEQKIKSVTGFVDNKHLVLPDAVSAKWNLQKEGLVILQDCISNQEKERVLPATHSSHYFFPISPKPYVVELFKITLSKDGSIRIDLDFESNQSAIGRPSRDNHTIGLLKENKALRYRINGKTDHGFSSGLQRTYIEYDYVIVDCGNVENVIFKTDGKCEQLKNVNLSLAKEINERKILY